MSWVKVENNTVVQKTFKSMNGEAGWYEAPEWVTNGDIQTGNGFVNPPPRVKTQEELATEIQEAVQGMMDSEARSIGYDSLLSVCTYATSPNVKFQAEGQYFVSRRDAIWTYCYTELAKVEAGIRTMPTVDEFLLELPALNLPA